MNNTNVIEGNPTKKFFIEMITRDISIEDAIIDLLDNSIDGANRRNPDNYDGLYINIIINESEFIIVDNCGGFSLETAQKYAFRFGRPESAPIEHNTIGRFGIGMKRSLFKMGKHFEVETQNQDNHFIVDVDVEEWSRKQQIVLDENSTPRKIDDWSFTYNLVEKRNDENGTIIKVHNLHEEVRELFKNAIFLNDLADDIQRQLNFSLLKGLVIILNGRKLEGKQITMLISEAVKPYVTEGTLQNDKIKYRIVAGLGGIGNPKDSGWYIYCNNRLVLSADTSNLTGWGISGTPKWHIDYVMFRGVLFLDAEDTINLPLTTTKKGIDATSEIYQTVLPLMRHAMIQVLHFLKKIPDMRDQANSYREMLCERLDKIDTVAMKCPETFNGVKQKLFIAPQLDADIIALKKQSVRIAYDANKELADMAKSHAQAASYKDLGEITFNYYLQIEQINNE